MALLACRWHAWLADLMAAETSQTLDRGLRVLEEVADSAEGLTITEIAGRMGIGRTVVYRLVVTLEQHALIRRGSDGRCRLGLGVLAMGRQLQPVVPKCGVPCAPMLSMPSDAPRISASSMEESLSPLSSPSPLDRTHVTYRVGGRSH